MIKKNSISYLAALLFTITHVISHANKPTYGDLTQLTNLFSSGKLDSVHLIYNQHTFSEQEQEAADYIYVKTLLFLSKYDDALAFCFNQIDKTNDINIKGKYEFIAANIFFQIYNYDKAKEYSLEAVNHIQDSLFLAKAHAYIHMISTRTGQKESYVNHIITANEIINHIPTDKITFLSIRLDYYHATKQYDSLILFAFKELSDSIEENLYEKSTIYNFLNISYEEKGILDSAIFYCKKNIDCSIKLGIPELTKEYANNLLKLYERKGDSTSMMTYLNIYNQAQNDSQYFSIEKYQQLYQIEEERKKQITQKQTSNYFIIVISIIIILVVFILFFLVRYFSKKINYTESLLINKKEKPRTYYSSPELEKEIKEKLFVFEETKGYLDLNCSLKNLSSKLKLKNQKYLSDYISKNFQKNFREYINDLRIDYCIELLKTDKKFHNYSLEALAKEVGFRSKSTFFQSFKDKTNQTPQQFKDSIK